LRLQLEPGPHLVEDGLDLDLDEGRELSKADDAGALRPGDQHLDAGWRLSHPIDVGDGAGGVEVGLRGFVGLRVLLRHQQNLLVLLHREGDGGDRGAPSHRQGHDQLGEDDVVPQRDERDPPQRGRLDGFSHGWP